MIVASPDGSVLPCGATVNGSTSDAKEARYWSFRPGFSPCFANMHVWVCLPYVSLIAWFRCRARLTGVHLGPTNLASATLSNVESGGTCQEIK